MNDERRHDDGYDEQDDDAFIARAKTALDASARDLDAATLSRLNRARHAALEAAGGHGRLAWVRWPAALATALSLALAVGLLIGRSDAPAPPGVAVEDLELLAGEDSLELYDEDLEFYAWLDAQQSSEG